MHIPEIARAWVRALAAQFRFKIILLSLIPLLISLLLWGALLAWRLQSVFDFIQSYFSDHHNFGDARDVLASLGLLTFKAVIVPLLSLWLLLPIMIMTSLLFVGVMAMPAIAKHVGGRDFPLLEQRHGASMLGSFAYSLASFFLFSFCWVVTLPLIFIPPIYVLVHPLLWGWLTYRVMSFDALANYADREERTALVTRHRSALLLIGIIAGLLGALPSALWMSGAMITFLPFFAGLAIWIYLLIFIFTGLWFQYYCLDALQTLRRERVAVVRDLN